VRRLALAVTLIAAGAAMSAAVAWPGGAGRNGGVFRYGTPGTSVQIDPQVAYVTTAWWLEYATAAKLFNWPDRTPPGAAAMLVPEAAASFSISNHGKTYAFTIRKGFRFSDGAPVTAKSFAYAIDRVANHDLSSPGAAFITDPAGTDIVGARAVNRGRALHVRGVTAKGDRLVIRLTRPDPSFLIKLTMPFFQATSTKLPLSHEVVAGYPSAGPYYVAGHHPDVLTSLRRNPYYGGKRPRHLRGVDVHWGVSEADGYRQVLANELDEGPWPAAEAAALGRQFGVNRSRFWAKPVPCVGWILLNTAKGVFRNNVRLRQAVSWAVDRRAYAAQSGPYAGSPWARLFPPSFPGLLRASPAPYSATPQIAKARRLARGHFGSGKVVLAYLANSPVNIAQGELARHALVALGFDQSNITMKSFSGSYFEYPPRHGWDLATSNGWCAGSPDPRDFFVPLLGNGFGLPPLIVSPTYREKIATAAKLVGNARLRAFGRLELEIDRNLVPVVPMRTYNNRYFFSNRVDPRSLSYSGVYSDWSIPALALK
jgi:peptide/nickel transport system substrate-binding protein